MFVLSNMSHSNLFSVSIGTRKDITMRSDITSTEASGQNVGWYTCRIKFISSLFFWGGEDSYMLAERPR